MEIESGKQKTGTPPDFQADGVAVWVNKTKLGAQYLSVQLFGKHGIKVNCFKYKPRKEAKQSFEGVKID